MVARYIGCGRFNDHNFIAMELLGDSLSDLRRARPKGAFSMHTTCVLGMQMLRCIQGVHDLHFLHRDVKPVSARFFYLFLFFFFLVKMIIYSENLY